MMVAAERAPLQTICDAFLSMFVLLVFLSFNTWMIVYVAPQKNISPNAILAGTVSTS